MMGPKLPTHEKYGFAANITFPPMIRSGTPLERKCLGFTFLEITIIGGLALILLPVQVVSTFPPDTIRIFRQVQRSLIVFDAFLYLVIFRTGLSGRKTQIAWAISLFAFCIWLIVSLS
jgi:hypothetical protein